MGADGLGGAVLPHGAAVRLRLLLHAALACPSQRLRSRQPPGRAALALSLGGAQARHRASLDLEAGARRSVPQRTPRLVFDRGVVLGAEAGTVGALLDGGPRDLDHLTRGVGILLL